MRTLLCLLSAVLLSVRADTDVPITSHWSGGFQGEACVPVTAELHSWTMTITFDQPIRSIDVWAADIAETLEGGKVYVLTNKGWNKDEHVGEKLCLTFQGHGNGDIVPKVTARLDSAGATTGTGATPSGDTTPTATTITTITPTTPTTTSTTPSTTTYTTTPTTTSTTTPTTTTTTTTQAPTTSTFKPGNVLAVKDNYFTYKGQKIFLSGGNLPWINYGYDFGDGQWDSRRPMAEAEFKKLQASGGNSIRVWVHGQGETAPTFDNNDMVTGLDSKGTFLKDFIDLLNLGYQYDIFVFPTLWNGAVNHDSHNRLSGLIRDSAKLQSYIDKALVPLATAVKGHPALGGWDIVNEPEGLLDAEDVNSEPCYDTSALREKGAGWSAKKFTFQEILRFINWQAAAIKGVDNKNLVTVGVSNPKLNTDKFGFINHFSDNCLVKAGGKAEGILDFYEFHSYSLDKVFDDEAVFNNSATDYGLSKPIVVGEFWEKDGGGLKIDEMFKYVYNNGYAGALSWDLLGFPGEFTGIAGIRDMNTNGEIPVTIE